MLTCAHSNDSTLSFRYTRTVCTLASLEQAIVQDFKDQGRRPRFALTCARARYFITLFLPSRLLWSVSFALAIRSMLLFHHARVQLRTYRRLLFLLLTFLHLLLLVDLLLFINLFGGGGRRHIC